MKPTWKIKNTDPDIVQSMSGQCDLEYEISSILFSRGYTNPRDIEKFLYANLSFLHSPFQMAGMREAVERIRTAVDRKENIAVFSDSDLDGVTSLTLLYRLFRLLNVQPLLRYLKDDEGYGLTNKIIDEFTQHRITLLITVDSGIRDVSEIKYARSLGIDVIVTDHHEQDETLPDAIIVNPKVHHCGYPFKHLAGVGVAFKLSHAVLFSYVKGYDIPFVLLTSEHEKILCAVIKNGHIKKTLAFANGKEAELATGEFEPCTYVFFESNDLEAVFRQRKGGTTFNLNELMVPVFNNNNQGRTVTCDELCKIFLIRKNICQNKIESLSRIFLEIQIRSSEKIFRFLNSVLGYVSIGVIADIMPLIDENRILVSAGLKTLNAKPYPGITALVSGKIDAKKIGWDIAPVLNTPGRMGRTDLLVDFFISEDMSIVNTVIVEIKNLNEKRKDLVRNLFLRFQEEILKNKPSHNNLIFIKSADVPEGLAGLIANMLSDSTGKPSIVVSLPGRSGIVKGSARFSTGNFFSLVASISNRFEKIGGHENAFGFSARIDHVDDIIQRIDGLLAEVPVSEKTLEIDCELKIEKINIAFIEKLSLLEPFGQGNEEPLFLTKNLPICSFTRFGKNNNHGSYTFRSDAPVSAIGWNKADMMQELFRNKRNVNVVYRLEANEFRNKISPRMIIQDLSYSL